MATMDTGAPIDLAECRRAGRLSSLPLHQLNGRAEAEAFQAEAMRALGGEPCGYKIGATGTAIQQRLNCREPFCGPILREHVLGTGDTFKIPAGLLGVECEYGFRLAEDFPRRGEPPSLASLRSAIAECFVALELVGRRVPMDIPFNEMTAIADFALNVVVVRGEAIPDWQSRDLTTLPVRAVVDGKTVVEGTGAAVLGHPLNALLWLAQALQQRGEHLRGGDIVFTGTCTGITSVAPGQHFAGCFADLPPVELSFA